MHEVLVNRLGGQSLPRKSVVRLTDRPDMTLDVYRGRKTTIQQPTTTGNKILGIRGEIASQEQFIPFFTIFSTYISNERSQITCSFAKFGSSIGIFLSSPNLICRSTDISKCFRGSLRLRDHESRL